MIIDKKQKKHFIMLAGKEWQITITRVSKDIDGDCDLTTRKIRISQRLDGFAFDHAVLHEIFHAILKELGFGNTTLHPDLNELISDGVSKILLENAEMKIKTYFKSTISR